MKRSIYESTFIQKEIDTLNEMAEDYVIYDESQCGPQEEPYVKEFKLDINKWKLYHRNKKSR